MALPIALPEHFKIVIVAPIAAANAVAYDTINCKNALKVWFLITHTGSNNTDMTITLNESTDVAGSTSTTVTATVPIWRDEDAGTASDALVRDATDAATVTIDADASANQLIVIEWDPAKFTTTAGGVDYDSIFFSDTGGHGSNNVTVIAIIETRYPQATPPSAIID